MKTTPAVSLGAAIFVAALLASLQGALNAGQQTPGIPIDNDDIGGVVTSAKGPEAGVWVIAETTDLPTKFVKIVVTDDQRPLPAARSAEGELQRVGARLRPGRFAEGAGDAGQDART